MPPPIRGFRKDLFTRGLKLLAIFVVLNVARTFIVPVLVDWRDRTTYSTRRTFSASCVRESSRGWQQTRLLLDSGAHQLFAGVLGGTDASVPILSVHFHIVCALLLLLILILGLLGERSLNLEFFTIGMLGVLAGFMAIAAINRFCPAPIHSWVRYLCYLTAVSVWDVPFPLLMVGVCSECDGVLSDGLYRK